MIKIDEDNYPIVSVKFEGVATSEETELYLARFSDWLARECPFGLILEQTDIEATEQSDRAKSSHELVVRWAKPNKPKIARYCVGIGVVRDLSKMPQRQQKMAPKAIGALFGCRGQVFGTPTAARQWLGQQLEMTSQLA